MVTDAWPAYAPGMRTTILAAVLAVAVAVPFLVAPARATACGGGAIIEPTLPFAIEQALRADDGADAAPAAPVVRYASVERADPETADGCAGEAAAKCDAGEDALVVDLEPPADDGAGGTGGEPQIGWVFRVVDGAIGAELPDGPVVAAWGGSYFAFPIDAGPADAVLEVTAVSRAGLASAPTRVHVQAGAREDDEGGCRTASGGPAGPSLLVLAWLALRRRR